MANRKRPSSDPNIIYINENPPTKRSNDVPSKALELAKIMKNEMEERQQHYREKIISEKNKKVQEREQSFHKLAKEVQNQRLNYFDQLLARGAEKRKQNEEKFRNYINGMATGNTSNIASVTTSKHEPVGVDDPPATQANQFPDDNFDEPLAYSFDSDEEDNTDVFPIDGFDFNGAQSRPTKMDMSEKIMCILLHQARFNTANCEIEGIVDLFNAMCDYERIPWTDWETLINKVPNKFLPTIYKCFYTSCEACGKLYGPIETGSDKVTCPHNQDTTGYFIYIKLSDWLRHIIKIRYEEINKILTKRTNRLIHDLPDTQYYQTFTKPTDDGIPVLTLTLGWNGAVFTNDGSKSMWPLIAYLNELPYQDRITTPMLLALDSNPVSPKDDLMFRPLVDELAILEKTPLEVQIDDQVNFFYVKLLLIIADAPARAKILNFNNHNGIYACQMCTIEGRKEKPFGNVLFRPQGLVPKRTNSEWRQIAEDIRTGVDLNLRVIDRKEKRKGIYGPCQLMRLSYIDIPTVCPSEFMHSVLLGVVNTLMERWRGKDNITSTNYYRDLKSTHPLKKHQISKPNVNIINKRLSMIKFPNGVHRAMPQFDQKGSWKSIHLENVLFYGWPAFVGVIDKNRSTNFMQLAFSISKLCSRNVTTMDIRTAKREIEKFIQMFDQIYSKNEAFLWKFNIHALNHLGDMVERYGPLPVQSAYSTENTMGIIVRRVMTGTNVSQQVANKILAFASVVSECNRSLASRSQPFLERFQSYFPKLASIVCRGKAKVRSLATEYYPTNAELLLLQKFGPIDENETFESLQRVAWQSQVVCTRIYNQTKAPSTINHCILTEKKNDFNIVIKIIQLKTSRRNILLCKKLLNCSKLPLYDDSKQLFFSYICTYSKESSYFVALPLEDVSELATYVTFNNTNYAFKIFNRHL